MNMSNESIRGLIHTRRFAAVATTVALIAVGTGVFISTRSSSPGVAAIPTTVADRGTVMVTVAGSGPVNALSPMSLAATSTPAGYSIYPSSAGQVVKTLVVPGDIVHVGQAIAVLTDPTVANNVLQAMIGVRTAQIAVKSAVIGQTQSRLDLAANKTQARLDLANATLAYQTLRKSSTAPDQLNAAQLAITVAQLKLDSLSTTTLLPSQLAAARLNVTVAQQQLAALIVQHSIDMNSAQLALQMAQVDLAALLVPPAASPSKIASAQLSVTLAQQQVATVANRIAVDNTAAELAVQKAQADLDALLAPPSASQVASAQLDLANAKASYSNLLLAQVPPTSTALLASQLAVTLAQQKLDAIRLPRGSVTLSNLQVAMSQSALELARLQQEGLTVRSPVSGTVTGVFIAPGAQVGPSVAVAAVADLKHLLVTTQMSEFDVAHIKPSDRALVDIAAIGQSGLPAKVVFVAPIGVNNAGVIQFPVTVSLLRAPTALRPGMLASVQVVTAQRLHVVRVPLDAIGSIVGGSNDGQPYVTLLGKTGHRTIRLVTLGLVGGTYAEITKGLKSGERLALPQVVSSGTSSSNSLPGIGVPSSQGQGGNN